jgi:hypothetical protein
VVNGSLARLFWRVLDALDYRLMQARLWLADAVCGPRSRRQWLMRSARPIASGCGRRFR